MITELELTLSEAPAGESTRVRCLGHIFNLCTKATFFPFKPTTTRRAGDRLVEIEDEDEDVWDLGEDEVMSDDGEEVDSTEEEPDTGRDVEDLRVVEELASEEVDGAEGGGRFERPLPVVIKEDWAVGRSAFKKVARLTKRIHFSTALSNELQMLCTTLGLKYLTIKRPVATRWNTWATTLGSVLHLRGPLTKLAMSKENIPSLSTQE
ncbi:hypothetical protein MPER_03748 [Moniliophthora perniciosa FA553]|nr:hypothetical protein MPER_03748 [Moniliophthora perniciosa FA553]